MLPSAAGVIDPLLSTGFPLTLLGIARLVELIERTWTGGDRDAALQSLVQAFKSGYREYAFLEPDPIFAPVRSDARFTAIIEQMKAEVERQRRLAAQRGLLDLESLAPGIK